MKEKVIYIADDGKEFDNKIACDFYENNVLNRMENVRYNLLLKSIRYLSLINKLKCKNNRSLSQLFNACSDSKRYFYKQMLKGLKTYNDIELLYMFISKYYNNVLDYNRKLLVFHEVKMNFHISNELYKISKKHDIYEDYAKEAVEKEKEIRSKYDKLSFKLHYGFIKPFINDITNGKIKLEERDLWV